ncbi:unnamed protein product [Closterium sp. Naga37s-1]|nr:unnamed protein product [Closterium sp. Naga37s-1]
MAVTMLQEKPQMRHQNQQHQQQHHHHNQQQQPLQHCYHDDPQQQQQQQQPMQKQQQALSPSKLRLPLGLPPRPPRHSKGSAAGLRRSFRSAGSLSAAGLGSAGVGGMGGRFAGAGGMGMCHSGEAYTSLFLSLLLGSLFCVLLLMPVCAVGAGVAVLCAAAAGQVCDDGVLVTVLCGAVRCCACAVRCVLLVQGSLFCVLLLSAM